jgi:hypothetical protein
VIQPVIQPETAMLMVTQMVSQAKAPADDLRAAQRQ